MTLLFPHHTYFHKNEKNQIGNDDISLDFTVEKKKRGIKILPTCQDEPCCPAVVAEPCVCLRAPIYMASLSPPPHPPTPALTLNFPRQTPPTC